MLSGFVISYAYDDRWGRGLTVGGFFRRRLIRLHPMVVIGALLGAATFLLQGSVQWDGTAVAPGAVLLAFAAACLFIPAWPGAPYEVRGNAEMFPSTARAGRSSSSISATSSMRSSSAASARAHWALWCCSRVPDWPSSPWPTPSSTAPSAWAGASRA